MANDAKETVNFRLDRCHKQALARLAAERDQAIGQLIREVVESYLIAEERRAWEEEARRASAALAEEADDPTSDEAQMLRTLDASLEEFAREWIWKDGE